MTRQTLGAGVLASPLLAVSQPLTSQFSYPWVPAVKLSPTHPSGPFIDLAVTLSQFLNRCLENRLTLSDFGQGFVDLFQSYLHQLFSNRHQSELFMVVIYIVSDNITHVVRLANLFGCT